MNTLNKFKYNCKNVSEKNSLSSGKIATLSYEWTEARDIAL